MSTKLRHRELRRTQSRDLYLSGLGLEDVAAELAVCTATVWKDLIALDIPRRRVGAPTKYAPAEPRECERPGCGKVFTPAAYVAAQGYGRFCSASCRSGNPPIWIVCEQCGTEYKVWAYRLRADRSTSPARFCSHSCWMKYNWAHGIAVSDAMIPLTNWRFRQKMKGKWAGPKGATGGVKGGRPVETTAEERQKMNDCLNAGLSQRQTAIAVFGDATHRHRVRSFIGS
jgi:hypothetical protein